MKTIELFDLCHTFASEYLAQYEYPWEALKGIKDFILSLGTSLDKNSYKEVLPSVWIHKTANIASTAYVDPPCIICAGSELRHCAFIRGNVLIGENCVVGNSTELKNVILFDGVQVPHFNYVGDSILGFKSHMGAGAITSNVKNDKSYVVVKESGESNYTGLKKFGAILGDFVEVGCNSVLNPGTVIGRNTNIYPLSCVRGVIPADSIYKSSEVVIKKTLSGK